MKHIFTFFFIIAGLRALSQDIIYVDATETNYVKPEEDSLSLADSLVQAAFIYEGVNYRYGGMSFDGMDCSGLICRAFIELNIDLPHSSTAISQLGEYIDADFLEKGDLIFFKGRTANSVGHVAMVSKIENGLIYIIHASTSRGVIEEVLQENSYFMDRWLFNRRIRKN